MHLTVIFDPLSQAEPTLAHRLYSSPYYRSPCPPQLPREHSPMPRRRSRSAKQVSQARVAEAVVSVQQVSKALRTP